jgi:Spy/CpxP family protein refolding chaperone
MKRGTTTILLLVFAIALATVSAHAQSTGGGMGGGGMGGGGMGGGGHKHQRQTDKSEPQKSKADEKAYNAALKSVPDKPKPDPWQGTR